MKNNRERLFIIDGMAQIYRAHFAMITNPLTTKDGRHTSVIYAVSYTHLTLPTKRIV